MILALSVLALCASSVMGSARHYRKKSRMKTPVAVAHAHYADAGTMYYHNDYEQYMMYEEAAENLERAQRDFAQMSRIYDEQQMRAQGGEVEEKEEFVWLLWAAARAGAKAIAKRAIKTAIGKLVKHIIKKWVAKKLGKMVGKKVMKETCKRYFKKYKVASKVSKKVKKRVKKTTEKMTEAMVDQKVDEIMAATMAADTAKLAAELDKKSVQTEITDYIDKQMAKYIDDNLKTSWAGMLPGVGEIELTGQVYKLLATDAIEKEVGKFMENKLVEIADRVAPDCDSDYCHIGCFGDSTPRALPIYRGDGYNADSCRAACNSSPYFALQCWKCSAGPECWCGEDWNSAVKYGKVDKCPAHKLGGSWANDLYKNMKYNP